MTTEQTQWLLDSPEPWTRYRTLIDLLDRPIDDSEVQETRQDLLGHPLVQELIAKTADWPGYALKRHNDARHPVYAFTTLADFGVQAADPGMAPGTEAVLVHQSPEGMFETYAFLYKRFAGIDGEHWTWMACDAPILYALTAMGLSENGDVQAALNYILGTVQTNGWRCRASANLGSFKGPGRREAPCPIVNVMNLRIIANYSRLIDSEAAHLGAEMLLRHWSQRGQIKHFMFGIGTDFRKLKYPFVWYDILHTVDVLSNFPIVCDDPRFLEMVETITEQADEQGRYTANSMYMAWKGWSFADKKEPSPWLTFLVNRILKRITN
ncbi:MAG: hypothetical protein ISR58_11500 [Anaerolineales bacterium]|nr:hypothetical protein [Chloroflexota bacterium]MBL6981800.1 hypothetical protein [Anaerolineales bacterium]